MKKLIFFILILCTAAAQGQLLNGKFYQPIKAPYSWESGWFKTNLNIPKDSATTGRDTGGIYYRLSDSSLYIWSGTTWRRATVYTAGDGLTLIGPQFKLGGAYANDIAVTSTNGKLFRINSSKTTPIENDAYLEVAPNYFQYFGRSKFNPSKWHSVFIDAFASDSAQGSYIKHIVINESGESSLHLHDSTVELHTGNALNSNTFGIKPDSGFSYKRISYNSNYGNSFTKHSLVDKNFVDSSFGVVPHFYIADGTITGTRQINANDFGIYFNNLSNFSLNGRNSAPFAFYTEQDASNTSNVYQTYRKWDLDFISGDGNIANYLFDKNIMELKVTKGGITSEVTMNGDSLMTRLNSSTKRWALRNPSIVNVDTTIRKPLVYNTSTQRIEVQEGWAGGSGGGGITTLNTLTGATQTFATGTTGTDFNIASATTTHTFNLPTASATNRGALSSADWTTFNNKVPYTLINGFTNLGSGAQVGKDTSSNKINLRSVTAIGGMVATQNANDIAISLPSQTANANKYLKTDGTNASWQNVAISIDSGTIALRPASPSFGDQYYQTDEMIGFYRWNSKVWEFIGGGRQELLSEWNSYNYPLMDGGVVLIGANAPSYNTVPIKRGGTSTGWRTGTSSTGATGWHSSNAASGRYDSVVVYFETDVIIPVLSNATESFTVWIGDTSSSISGIFFRYTHNNSSGNWEAVCKATTSTIVNTSVAPVTVDRFQKLSYLYDYTSGWCKFYIDNTLVATITTTLPSTGNYFRGFIVKSAGTTDREIRVNKSEIRTYER